MRNLIPKPTGQAGQTNGYSLFKELKLPQARYSRILVSLDRDCCTCARIFIIIICQRITRVIASHGLDPTKSIREQEKPRMKAVVAKVCDA